MKTSEIASKVFTFLSIMIKNIHRPQFSTFLEMEKFVLSVIDVK